MNRTLLFLILTLNSSVGLAWNNGDEDGDGIPNQRDNCAFYANADQADADLNGIGDACESAADPSADVDGDGVPDLIDNCPNHANSDQKDQDTDYQGDACDSAKVTSYPLYVYTGSCGGSISTNVLAECANGKTSRYGNYGVNDPLRFTGAGECKLTSYAWLNNKNHALYACANGENWNDADVDQDGIKNGEDDCWQDATNTCTPEDDDSDGIANHRDNCRTVANPSQRDLDGDSELTSYQGDIYGGDACDSDADGDGVNNDKDNCRFLANPDQLDTDFNGKGDACEAAADPSKDRDGDTIPDVIDNCPDHPNTDQNDSDTDYIGDVCDPSTSTYYQMKTVPGSCYGYDSGTVMAQCKSGLSGLNANTWGGANPNRFTGTGECKFTAYYFRKNSGSPDYHELYPCPSGGDWNEYDVDLDGIKNGEDDCWLDATNTCTIADYDSDGVPDHKDNCRTKANPRQEDTDDDAQLTDSLGDDTGGDACDSDADNDGVVNEKDNCRFLANSDQLDANSNGIGDACEAAADKSQDRDGDTIPDLIDNCPDHANTDQKDRDTDYIGDVCDSSFVPYHEMITYPGDCAGSAIDTVMAPCEVGLSGLYAAASSSVNPQRFTGTGECQFTAYHYRDNRKGADYHHLYACPGGNDWNENDVDLDGIKNGEDDCWLDASNTCTIADYDSDGVPDHKDNCRTKANPGQEDTDGDAEIKNYLGDDYGGDACDSDADNDGVVNERDNCRLLANSDQLDANSNGIGDACEAAADKSQDRDGDTIPDLIDNCPDHANTDQKDQDTDYIGDACDTNTSFTYPMNTYPGQCGGQSANTIMAQCETGSSGLFAAQASSINPMRFTGTGECQFTAYHFQNNKKGTDYHHLYSCPSGSDWNEIDVDKDGIKNGEDDCWLDATNTCIIEDEDGDGVPDHKDNCRKKPNPGQEDIDGDTEIVNYRGDDNGGDVCDSDADGDGITNITDNCQFFANPDQLDSNYNGIGDACESTADLTQDRDGDTIPDVIDNCPDDANTDQKDTDTDNIGDVCDTSNSTTYPMQTQAGQCGGSETGTILAQCARGISGLYSASRAAYPQRFTGSGECVYSAHYFLDNRRGTDYHLLYPCPRGGNWNEVDIDRDGIPNGRDRCYLDASNTCEIEDIDGDGVPDHMDNCRAIANPRQLDTDADTVISDFLGASFGGDACDPDADNDGILNASDNCVLVPNQDQLDENINGIGDACETLVNHSVDGDGDGIGDLLDNCPEHANPDQKDYDNDNIGDACDTSISGHRINIRNYQCGGNAVEPILQSCTSGVQAEKAPSNNPRAVSKPKGECIYYGYSWGYTGSYTHSLYACPSGETWDEYDTDGDKILNGVDPEPFNANVDTDGDGILNRWDNCWENANADQTDLDRDFIGDVCDPLIDNDRDGIANESDNCVDLANPDQIDLDKDSIGDACDPIIDSDYDMVPDATDNCKLEENPLQEDSDNDGLGDACDPDRDDDSILNDADNCPAVPNPGQENLDGDELGDLCDTDLDNDTVANAYDNCPRDVNPKQIDVDHDGIGDVCDPLVDRDGDSIPDAVDNCMEVVNPEQKDMDADSIGDACDNDKDGDGFGNDADNCPVDVNPDQLDSNFDGIGDMCQPDYDPPTITFYDLTTALRDGDDLRSPGAIVIRVDDDLDLTPDVTSITVTRGGVEISGLTFKEDPQTKNDYIMDKGVVIPGEEPLVFSVTATDYKGNEGRASVSVNFKEPPIRSLTAGRAVQIPSVDVAFENSDGHGPMRFKVTDMRHRNFDEPVDISAMLPADAPYSVKVNGVVINPGQSAKIVQNYDVTINSWFNPTITPVTSGSVGETNVTFITDDPRAPYYQGEIEFWAPDISVAQTQGSLRAVIDTYRAELFDESRNCRLTASVDMAKTPNPFTGAQCYVSHVVTSGKGVYELKGSSTVYLEGYASEAGQVEIDYSIGIYNPGTDTFVPVKALKSGHTSESANGYTDFVLDRSPEMAALVDFIEAPMVNVGGSCAVFAKRTEAIEYSKLRRGTQRPACLLVWTDLPGNLKQGEGRNVPWISGNIVNPGDYNLGWKVVTFTPDETEVTLEEDSVMLKVTNIAPPAINFEPASTDMTVPVSGGYFGYVRTEGYNAQTVVELYKDDELLMKKDFRRSYAGTALKTALRLNIPASVMYADNTYRIKAYYDGAPENYAEEIVKVVTVPNREVGPTLTVASLETLSTDSYPVQVNIGNMADADVPYDQRTMGRWQVRLVEAVTARRSDPLTDWSDANGGSANFNLDLTGNPSRTLRLMAEARLVLEDSELDYLVKSRRALYVSIKDGAKIESTLSINSQSAPAPFNATITLLYANRNQSREVGDIKWFVKSGDGAWMPAESIRAGSSNRFVYRFARGDHKVKARLYNKHSGAEAETPELDLSAYLIPDLKVIAPSSAFVTDAIPVKAEVRNDGVLVDSSEMEFYWSEDKTNWSPGSDTYILKSDEIQRKVIYVRARYKDAPLYDADRKATNERFTGVTFKPIKEPVININGPLRAEVGVTYTWKANIRTPYPGMINETGGVFTMPDGSKVSGTEVTYTVRQEDLDTDAGKMVVNFVGWVEGFADKGAKRSLNFASRAWKYIWPDFSLSKRVIYNYAPTTITLKALQMGAPVPLDNPIYAWSIPDNGVTIKQENRDAIRVVDVIEPGNYTFGVTVSDARGNETTRTIELEIKEPPGFELDARMSKSNKYDRAPLKLSVRARASGGHPADRVNDLVFKVDGVVIKDMGSFARTELAAGDHTLTIELASKMGQVASKDFPIVVKENQPPTCELIEKSYSSTWSYTAACSDPDGKIKKYKWLIDGKDPGRSSVRMAVPKSQYDAQPPVQVIGIDDAGAESIPATN